MCSCIQNVLALRLFQKGFHLLISLLDSAKAPLPPPHPNDGEDAEPAGVVADRRGSPSGRPILHDVIVIGSAPPTRHFDVDTGPNLGNCVALPLFCFNVLIKKKTIDPIYIIRISCGRLLCRYPAWGCLAQQAVRFLGKVVATSHNHISPAG